MTGASQPQPNLFHTVQLDELVPQDHPLRKIRPLVDTERIRELSKPFYCENNGRPSIPPEQLIWNPPPFSTRLPRRAFS